MPATAAIWHSNLIPRFLLSAGAPKSADLLPAILRHIALLVRQSRDVSSLTVPVARHIASQRPKRVG